MYGRMHMYPPTVILPGNRMNSAHKVFGDGWDLQDNHVKHEDVFNNRHLDNP